MSDEKHKPDIEAILADEAVVVATMQRAVRDALLQHKRAGNPIATWQDDKVVWIAPEDIPVADPRDNPRRKRAQRGKRAQSKTRAKRKR